MVFESIYGKCQIKNTGRILTYGLLVSSAALLVIIICAEQFQWGKHSGTRVVSPEEMLDVLKNSDVVLVYTTDFNSPDGFHSPDAFHAISLQTKFGFEYYTQWNQMLWPHDEKTDANDIVTQILIEERGLKRGKDFQLINTD